MRKIVSIILILFISCQKDDNSALIAQYDEVISNYSSQINALNNQVLDLNNLLNNNQDENNSLTNELANSLAENNSLTNELANSQAENNSLIVQLLEVQDSNAEIQSLYDTIQSLYDSIEEEYNSLVESVSTVSIVSLSSENSLLYEQIDALSLQVEALTTQVNIITLQLTDSNEQLQSLLAAQSTAASSTSSSTSSQSTTASSTSSSTSSGSTSSQSTTASSTSSSTSSDTTSSETTASSETQTSTTTDDSNSSLGNFQIGSLEFYNGNLYVGTHNKILKVDLEGNISTYLGIGGEIDIDIDGPGSDFITGLKFDNNGALYFGADRTLRKLVGSQITTIYSSGVSTGGIVINSNNDIFVPMCCANQTMRKIDQSGNVSTFINQGGNVYGADIKDDIIYMAYSNGKIKTISSTNTSSNGPEELHTVTSVVDFLTSIKIDQSGNLYILNSSNNPNGKLIKVVNGSETVLINNLWSTRGLDFDDNGNLYVGDMGRIHKLAPDGTVSVFINTRQ